jgi:hypothetical protein
LRYVVERIGTRVGDGRLLEAGLLDRVHACLAVATHDRFIDPRLQARIILKGIRKFDALGFNRDGSAARTLTRLMIPFQDVHPEHPERTFELVELFPPRGLDLLRDILPVDLVPAPCSGVPWTGFTPGCAGFPGLAISQFSLI